MIKALSTCVELDKTYSDSHFRVHAAWGYMNRIFDLELRWTLWETLTNMNPDLTNFPHD